MKRNTMQFALAVLAFAAANAMGADFRDEPVKVNTEGLQRHVAQQVQQHANESLGSLMQYLWFTRKIHGLWLDDVMKPENEKVATNDTSKERGPIIVRTTGLR